MLPQAFSKLLESNSSPASSDTLCRNCTKAPFPRENNGYSEHFAQLTKINCSFLTSRDFGPLSPRPVPPRAFQMGSQARAQMATPQPPRRCSPAALRLRDLARQQAGASRSLRDQGTDSPRDWPVWALGLRKLGKRRCHN